ncbi:MAG: hypothetical protein GWN62_23275, partial [Aliifodinibius sp.]|nr:hypothetical protein [Fodinibius sp.]
QLEQAGFSESEIQGYIARQSNRLQQAGFSESEISRHWGQPEEPTHPIQKVGPVAPAIQRMQQPTTGTTAMAEYLESFIKGTTFGA